MKSSYEGLLLKDPIGAFDKIRDNYIRYFKTMYSFKNEVLDKRKNIILDDRENSVLFKDPYVELLPEYRPGEMSIDEWIDSYYKDKFPNHFSDFIKQGLMEYKPYSHQLGMLEKSFCKNKNVLITSGTGSGKTESFLLPLFASLLKDLEKFGEESYNPEWYAVDKKYKAVQRLNENRQSAIKALVMYPMNALVNDQMTRLRKALDSYEIRDIFDKYYKGNRIFFGQYKGDTIGSRNEEDGDGEYCRKQLLDIIDDSKELQRSIEASNIDEENLYISPLYREDDRSVSGEMLTRWDMQEHCPDILITNFSMLNIMLTRRYEQKMIEDTRTWFVGHPEHVFHLVIDEIHLYRGTSGTEVALLLRNFLNRIGVPPFVKDGKGYKPNPQLRILASSASLNDNKETLKFLNDFFGVFYKDENGVIIDRPTFEIQKGDVYETESVSDFNNWKAFDIFVKNIDGFLNGDRDRIFNLFLKIVGCESKEEFLSLYAGSMFNQLYDNFGERPVDIKRYEEFMGGADSLRGFFIFRGDPEVNSLCTSYKLPRFRFHNFYKYVEGLWGELTDEKDINGKPMVIGQMSFSAKDIFVNEKGVVHRGLELLRCEVCGELYIGGNYKRLTNNTYVLSLNSPELGVIPNMNPTPMVQKKRHSNYMVFWPSTEKIKENKYHALDCNGNSNYSGNNSTHCHLSWKQGFLNPDNGLLYTSADVKSESCIEGYYIHIEAEGKDYKANSIMALPTQCPSCGSEFRHRKYTKSPIRSFRSGIKRSNQILSKELIYQMPEENRKLIGFSDSRQDAAEQCSGIAREHFRDIVRMLFVECVNEKADLIKGEIIESLRDNCDRKAEKALKQLYFDLKEVDGRIMNVIEDFVKNNFPLDDEDIVDQFVNTLDFGEIAIPLNNLIRRSNDSVRGNLVDKLVALGINPLGPDYKYQNIDGKFWAEYCYCKDGVWYGEFPVTKYKDYNTELIQNLSSKIFKNCFGQYMGLNSEDSGLGYVTLSQYSSSDDDEQYKNLKRVLNIEKDEEMHRVIDAVIRMLGDKFRYDDPDFSVENISEWKGKYGWPTNIRKVFGNFSGNGVGIKIHEYFMDRLAKGIKLSLEKLSFIRVSNNAVYYKCSNCQRNHLHRGTGYCTRCGKPLDVKPFGCVKELHDNFISYDILKEPREARRLHTEELTGQTDDQISRLLEFKGVVRGNDLVKKGREVDMLNVTTTMEVGVDIGSLTAVYNGNMPPTRYNYQQRVGRCGRRNTPFCTAYTFCRSKSHDTYYYNKALDEITGGTPDSPSLSLPDKENYSDAIISRVILKEVLRRAFVSMDINVDDLGNDIHGDFGKVCDWDKYEGRVVEWISSHEEEIRSIINYYTVQFDIDISHVDELVDWLKGDVAEQIRQAVKKADCEGNAQAMAEAGLLPIFGMPTVVRNFYHGRDFDRFRTIDRPVEQSITEFAPGAIKEKDHGSYKSVGLTVPFEGAGRYDLSDPKSDALEHSYLMMIKKENENETIVGIKDYEHNAGVDSLRLVIPKAFRTGRIYGNNGDLSDNQDDIGGFSQSEVWVNDDDRIISNGDRFDFDNVRVRYWNCSRDVKPEIWTINRNGGRCFKGRYQIENSDKRIPNVNVECHEDIEKYAHKLPNFIIDGESINGYDGQEDTIALGCKKVTEMIEISVKNWDMNLLDLSADREDCYKVKAAYYSAACIIQRYLADKLDIDPEEIEISEIKKVVVGDVDNYTSARNRSMFKIYLNDKLANGSGYIGMLVRENERGESMLETILKDIVKGNDADSEFVKRLFAHKGECVTACENCLKTFYNQGYHHVLDWRLGIDIIKLMLDEKYVMGRDDMNNTPYADMDYIFNVAMKQNKNEYYVDYDNNQIEGVNIVHPLWKTELDETADVFDILRVGFE